MPRLLHMADVHLGARHDDLGPAAAAQRERQFGAFHRAVELAISEKVDLVLIAGDLFDSNAQPRRSVERAASELARLAERRIPVVIIPGTHDCYEPSSIYRVFDLPAMSRSKHGSQTVTVLTDGQPRIDFPQLDLTVHGLVSATKRAAQSPLANFSAMRPVATEAGSPADSPSRAGSASGSPSWAGSASGSPSAASPSPGPASAGKPLAWQVGMIHGSLAVPGKFDQDDVIFNEAEVAASGLHYLALGHWHSFREGRAGNTVWAYSGAPEPVAVDQDGAGQVLIVELADRNGRATVAVQPRPVGRTVFQKLELDAAAITSQGDLERMLRERADPDRVLDVRLVGVKPDQTDLSADELERQLNGSFLRLRVRDASVAALPETTLAPADTIIGAFTRDFGARIADHEARGDTERAAELREALRLGTLLLDDPHRVTLA